MTHKEPPFGFWIPVKDRASATYAAKMSGLPVFLMGLSFIALGVLQLFATQIPLAIAISSAMILGGGFLVFSGLQIRNLKFRTLPISIGLWLVLNLAGVTVAGFGLGSILTLFIGILTISGLRGWFWLRRNPHDEEVF